MQRVVWKVGDRLIDLTSRGIIMGVLNVTPDSFSDGGEFFSPDKAVARGIELATEGAQIIDVGGESTRPGAEPVSTQEELRRTRPVVQKLHDQIPGGVAISIDTSKSEIARAALDVGAKIVNDVSGGRNDGEMMPLVAGRNAAIIIMHMKGEPRTMQKDPHYTDVVAEVADFFRQQYTCALEYGIDPMAIAFDPGIGFGKTLDHNLQLLANLTRLRVHERPLVVGVSRKHFLGKLAGTSEMDERLGPGVALTALLRSRGAEIFRVHDVKENVGALRVAEAIREH